MDFGMQFSPSKGKGSAYQIREHKFFLFINGI